MPDWKVTLSRPVMVNGMTKTLQTDHIVQAIDRNVAIPVGIDEIFKAEAAIGYQLVPKEAVDYWKQWRLTGGYLYEFQTEAEGKWGISFGISQIVSEDEAPPPSPHRNGTSAPAGELPDLNLMLQNHLKMLQSRSAVLSDQLQRAQAEYDRINNDIMRIMTMVTVDLTVPPPPLPPVELANADRDRISMSPVLKRNSRTRKPPERETNTKTPRVPKPAPIHHAGNGDEAASK